MRVFHDINSIKGLVIALGYFDGIHLGHKKIIESLVRNAKAINAHSAVITFSNNPANYFSPKEPVLSIQTFKDRELILRHMDVDYLYELDFQKYKEWTAKEYLEMLCKHFEPKYIIAGYNHTFGKNKLGNADYLMKNAKNYNYNCLILPEQKYKSKETLSSSVIREHIKLGHLNTAKALLGRAFSVRNSVIKGSHLARKLGYPTVNVVWPSSMVKLPHGVYFGFCEAHSKTYPALISWGTKPTLTEGKEEVLEAHIYNFNKSLYGYIVKVMFIKKLRDQEDFQELPLLKRQLDRDYAEFQKWAKRIIGSHIC